MVKYGVVEQDILELNWLAICKRMMEQRLLFYDPDNAEVIAEELGAKVASSLDELVSSDEVDCVIVATQIIFIRNRLLRLHSMVKCFL